MSYILGIDQGGTKTFAAITDTEGNILSCHRSAGSFMVESGVPTAVYYMMEAAKVALDSAGLKAEDISSVVAGVKGINWPGDDIMVKNELAKHFTASDITACNYSVIAYYSGTVSDTGAVLCAGTGINAALFSGGNCFILGDYLRSSLQGATALSVRAIEAVFQSEIGALPETALTELFLDFAGEKSIDALLKRFMCDEEFLEKIKGLTPKIKKLSDEGDEVALDLMTAFAGEVTACFIGALKKKNMVGLDRDIVLTGSVFGRTDGLTAMIADNIKKTAVNANIVYAVYEPIIGACLLGIIKDTGFVSKDTEQRVRVSTEKFNLLRI